MIPGLFTLKGYAITGALTLAIGFGIGWTARDVLADRDAAKVELETAQEATKQATATLRATEASQAITDDLGAKSATRQIEIRNTTNEIVREVPVYVTQKSDAGCVVPAGFVRLHDRAASGQAVPDAAGTPNDAASGVGLSTVAGTVAANYGQCRAEIDRLTALQDWVKAQAASWSDPNP